MGKLYNIDNAESKKDSAIKSIESSYEIIDPACNDSIKRHFNYYNWIENKSALFKVEKEYQIPNKKIPTKISKFIYNKRMSANEKKIVDKYYQLDEEGKSYFLQANKSKFKQEEIDTLVHRIFLQRGNVVWIEFGFNIGTEFGGKHPAIILKNIGKSLLVVPISTQEPGDSVKIYNLKIPYIYNLANKDRWVNVRRLVNVSIMRVELPDKPCNVKGEHLDKVSKMIKEDGFFS